MLEKLKDKKTLFSGLVIMVLIIGLSAFLYLSNRSEKVDTGLSQRAVTSYNSLADDAVITTSLGKMTIHFLKQSAPLAVNTFIKIADAGKYNGLGVDKMTKDYFSVPAPTSAGVVKWSEYNKEKISLGAVAVLNSSSNDGAFLIFDTYENSGFDGQYDIFARVTGGLDVLQKISKASHDSKGVPVPTIKIIKVELK